MKSSVALFLASVLVLAGCSSGNSIQGDISGVIFDESGDIVRGATVRADGVQSVSNSSGAYVLQGVRTSGDIVVTAEIRKGGTRYFGQNLARVFTGERTKNHNIAVYPDTQLASLEGTVEDGQGFLITGARVFARQNDGSVLSSAYGITDNNGRYKISGLRANLEYAIVANALDFDSQTAVATMSPGQNRILNFIIPDASGFTPPAPTNFFATAWTSPKEVSRDRQQSQAIEAIKQIIDKRRADKKVASRDTVTGDYIEVDLFWDRVASQYLLGYGIYRGSTVNNLSGIEFLRDPLAEFFADLDRNLIEGTTYVYAATSLSTSFNGGGQGESNLSNTYAVETLGQLEAQDVTKNPLRFHWNSAFGAEEYSVFIFDEYPGIGVQSRFNNFNNPVFGTSYTYDGPALQPGKTYYYVILGTANGADSRTISRVRSFVY